MMDAVSAEAAGLITRLVAADKLEAEALNLAAPIATQSRCPLSVRQKKPSTPLLTQRWKADYKWSGVFFMLPADYADRHEGAIGFFRKTKTRFQT